MRAGLHTCDCWRLAQPPVGADETAIWVGPGDEAVAAWVSSAADPDASAPTGGLDGFTRVGKGLAVEAHIAARRERRRAKISGGSV